MSVGKTPVHLRQAGRTAYEGNDRILHGWQSPIPGQYLHRATLAVVTGDDFLKAISSAGSKQDFFIFALFAYSPEQREQGRKHEKHE